MGLLNAYNQWKENKYQNFVSNMKYQGKCPDCHGRGYTVYPYNEFAYFNSYECPGCQGSGLYQDWEQARM
jgi:DnaJ-class molecular chaperone